jgi:hypothetical protein
MSSHFPRRISAKIAMRFAQKGFDSSALVAQAKGRAVAGVTRSLIRPGQNNIAQGLQGDRPYAAK